jgi:hypothetical protein
MAHLLPHDVGRSATFRFVVLTLSMGWCWPALAELAAFPGAVGQGAAATGGRGGEVRHVTDLRDYNQDRGEAAIPGSLRYAVEAPCHGPRTIVFDVSGAIRLSCPLLVNDQHDLTIAGQTSPGGITLWGYPMSVTASSNIVIRFLRIRTGDFNAMKTDAANVPLQPAQGNGNKDLVPDTANAMDVGHGSDRVIIDHVSASWGMDELLSVTLARNVTVQNCIIAESLNNSFHYKGEHGYGSLVRGEVTADDQRLGTGGYTFYGNLWAHNRARNPSIGGQHRLVPGQREQDRHWTDLNLVNNVIYDWGDQPTHRSYVGNVRVNIVGNYYVNGPSNPSQYVFTELDNNSGGTSYVYQQGNYHDGDQDAGHNGRPIDTPRNVKLKFVDFGRSDKLLGAGDGAPFNFFRSVASHVIAAPHAYDRVVRAAGASLWRDAVDQRIISDLAHRTGGLVDSQDQLRDSQGLLSGIDNVPAKIRTADFDTDGDGMPNQFEIQHGLDPNDPTDGNATDLSEDGYTNLEVYLNSLVAEVIGPDAL